jgi:hypothetical protein
LVDVLLSCCCVWSIGLRVNAIAFVFVLALGLGGLAAHGALLPLRNHQSRHLANRYLALGEEPILARDHNASAAPGLAPGAGQVPQEQRLLTGGASRPGRCVRHGW